MDKSLVFESEFDKGIKDDFIPTLKEPSFKVPSFEPFPAKLEQPPQVFPERPNQEDIVSGDGFSQTISFVGSLPSFNSTNAPCFLAYFPCELVAVNWWYGAAAAAGCGFYITKIGTNGGQIVPSTSLCLLDQTAQVSYSKNKKDHFNKVYSYLQNGDGLTVSGFNSSTGLSNLVITLHFRYSGRGEQRLN